MRRGVRLWLAPDSAKCCHFIGQVTPAIAVALVNWLSVTWLMQLKP